MGLRVLFLVMTSLFLQGKISAQELVEMKLTDSISIPFESGSSVIRNPSTWLARINQTKITGGKVQLIAYTDTVGSSSDNLDRITCKGCSNTSKLVPESTEENKRKNMRVDVVFTK